MPQLVRALIGCTHDLMVRPGGAILLARVFELEAPAPASRPLARDLCCELAQKLKRSYVKFVVRPPGLRFEP